jgi:MOSC domain-containing protein YiiM
MKVISLNVGEPQLALHHDRQVLTGIFKYPVEGPLLLRQLNFEGDRQADLTVHGGRNKAVYAYPSEHYVFWRTELPEMDLPWGMFGENLTTEGLKEEDAGIGDRFRIGEAVLAVTQPRLPCYKLGVRFGRDDIVKRFLASRRSGIYFSVIEEGTVRAGNAIEVLHRHPEGISIADINRAFVNSRENLPLLKRIVDSHILPQGLHQDFADELALLTS